MDKLHDKMDKMLELQKENNTLMTDIKHKVIKNSVMLKTTISRLIKILNEVEYLTTEEED
ncbi:MAG: hypothetical protein U9N54_06670 [candidate division Zixibacteria bacterium]|nr:hypothetical protein [candidate division Zixibacteria bacterium]